MTWTGERNPASALPAATAVSDLGDATVIHGYPGDRVVLEDVDGHLIGPLHHAVLHSPTGFAWGYGGSGPAELARCILLAVLGKEAICPTCDGSGFLVPGPGEDDEIAYDPAQHSAEDAYRCWACDQGVNLPGSLYQNYKSLVVAQWPGDREFRVSVAEVRAWLAEHR